MKGVRVQRWAGVAFPSATPDPIVKKWESAITEMVKDPAFLAAADRINMNIDFLNASDMRAFVEKEVEATPNGREDRPSKKEFRARQVPRPRPRRFAPCYEQRYPWIMSLLTVTEMGRRRCTSTRCLGLALLRNVQGPMPRVDRIRQYFGQGWRPGINVFYPPRSSSPIACLFPPRSSVARRDALDYSGVLACACGSGRAPACGAGG